MKCTSKTKRNLMKVVASILVIGPEGSAAAKAAARAPLWDAAAAKGATTRDHVARKPAIRGQCAANDEPTAQAS